MLTDPARAETEEVIDFGHARAFFPDADVFPNVVVARRPDGTDVPDSLTVAVPPRETLPDERLGAAVHAASFPLLRASLGREGWALEPKPVMDLLAKVWLVLRHVSSSPRVAGATERAGKRHKLTRGKTHRQPAAELWDQFCDALAEIAKTLERGESPPPPWEHLTSKQYAWMTLPQVRLARHSRIDSLWPWRMRRTEWPVAPPRRGLVRR